MVRSGVLSHPPQTESVSVLHEPRHGPAEEEGITVEKEEEEEEEE